MGSSRTKYNYYLVFLVSSRYPIDMNFSLGGYIALNTFRHFAPDSNPVLGENLGSPLRVLI